PEWQIQLADIGANPPGHGLAAQADPIDALYGAADLLALLRNLPRLPLLVDPPGAGWIGRGGGRPSARLGGKVLARVRAVLATAAMAAAGAAPAPRRYRSRAFRQSFLVAFATRIGQRLREAAEASVAEAESQHGVALLPVLASRAEAVDGAVDGAFPGLRG